MTFEQIYKNDIFANEAGITIEHLDEQQAVMSVKVEPRHLNGGGVAHGGLIYTLADIAMAAIANYVNMGSLSIQSDIRFLSAGRVGDTLTARATFVFGRKSLSNCRAEITNQEGELIALADGMCYIKRSFSAEASKG
ncbi:MAG: PaaI family thioesterase [Rikenellaceae bacterium]